MQRYGVAAQLQALLIASGALGGASSAFLSTKRVEAVIQGAVEAGRTFPIAAVSTLPGKTDRDGTGRVDEARFVISFAGAQPTESRLSQYIDSGGDGSSQVVVETAIAAFLSYCQSLQAGLAPGLYTQTTHGFQGRIENEAKQRLAVVPAGTYIVAELELTVYDGQQTTTGSISPPVPPPAPSLTVSVTTDTALSADDTKKVFVVTSAAADDVELTLPPWSQDLQYSFVSESAFTVEIDAQGGDQIQLAARSGAALQTVAKGTLTLRATVSGVWTVFYATGSGWQFAQEAGPT